MSYNILIVDDSVTIRAVIAKILGLAKIPLGELFEASNGREALELLNENWVDLVIADINMPEMNGVEMIEKMDKDVELSSIPVIIASTEGSESRIAELTARGVKAYVRKPFTPEELKNVVEKVMEVANG